MDLFSFEVPAIIDAFFDKSEEKPVEEEINPLIEALDLNNNSDDMIVLHDEDDPSDDFVIHSEQESK
jgi:hypothetical protein